MDFAKADTPPMQLYDDIGPLQSQQEEEPTAAVPSTGSDGLVSSQSPQPVPANDTVPPLSSFEPEAPPPLAEPITSQPEQQQLVETPAEQPKEQENKLKEETPPGKIFNFVHYVLSYIILYIMFYQLSFLTGTVTKCTYYCVYRSHNIDISTLHYCPHIIDSTCTLSHNITL